MKRLFLVVVPLFLYGFLQAQKPFSEGSLIVYRAGDGSEKYKMNASKSVPLFLDEYKVEKDGALKPIQSIAMPTVSKGEQKRCTTAPNSPFIGAMTRSADGKLISVSGYNVRIGRWTTTQSATQANRVVALVNYDAEIDARTALQDAYSKQYNHASATNDGSEIWVSAGNNKEANDGGFRYVVTGEKSSKKIDNKSFRSFFYFEGQLYASDWKNVFRVGDGFPSLSNANYKAILDKNIAGTNVGGFCMISTDKNEKILYLADAVGAVKKYSFVDNKWIWNGDYTWDFGEEDAPRFVQVKVDKNKIFIYVACTGKREKTSQKSAEKLYLIEDTAGYNAGFSEQSIAKKILDFEGQNKALKGIVWAPDNNKK